MMRVLQMFLLLYDNMCEARPRRQRRDCLKSVNIEDRRGVS